MQPARSTVANRHSLSQQARDYLLARIAEGELKPGDRIVESRVAEALQISSIPVREAIRELAAMRILDYSLHKGARVREGSVAETVDALSVKAVLEGLAARQAGKRLADCVPALSGYLKLILKAALRHDWTEYQNQNQGFHRTIVEASGNEILLSLWESLAFNVRTRFIMGFLKSVDPAELAEEHEAVLRAIKARNIEKVASLLASHANNLAEHLKKELGK